MILGGGYLPGMAVVASIVFRFSVELMITSNSTPYLDANFNFHYIRNGFRYRTNNRHSNQSCLSPSFPAP